MNRDRFRREKTRGRRSAGLLPKPLILVICEGKETEPLYFEALRRSKHLPRGRLCIETGAACGGTAPAFLVNAKKLKRKISQRDELKYDEVWCVFDRDDHPSFGDALAAADKAGVDVAYSVPCFELLYLLHFADQTAHIERDDVIAKLRKAGRLPDYTKSMPGVYDKLRPKQDEATRRAERLRAYHRRNDKSETTNPSTIVDKLVARLEAL
jgi:hypothetical protein